MTEATIELVIPSEVRYVDLVHGIAQCAAQTLGFEEDAALDLALAAREATINAIVHGHRRDPARKVQVRLRAAPGNGIRIEVCDEGPGFDPERAPDPRARENRLRDSGRGLLLMRAFVDEVRFERRREGGMRVVLLKKMPGRAAARKTEEKE